MKILIADDSAFMRKMLKACSLEAVPDAQVLEAHNGNEVLEIYQTHKPDLVLLDLIMPEKTGMDALQEIGKHTPCIVVSASGQPDMKEKSLALGAKEFIDKPFEEDDIIDVVRRYSSSS